MSDPAKVAVGLFIVISIGLLFHVAGFLANRLYGEKTTFTDWTKNLGLGIEVVAIFVVAGTFALAMYGFLCAIGTAVLGE